MTNSEKLTRDCSSCGLIKPLAAFLQINAKGTSYGSICSECRQTVEKLKHASHKENEGDSTSSGFRIDARAKIAIEQEKKRQHQLKKDTDQDELKKKNLAKSNKTEHTETKLEREKDHRQFIENQKNRFSSTNAPKQKTHLTTRQWIGAELPPLTQANHQARDLDIQRQHEKILTTADMTIPFMVALFHEVRFQSQHFQQFKTWLGGGSPLARFGILRALEQAYQQNTSLKQFINTAQANTPSDKKSTDPLIEYIDKTWHPSSSKRR